MRIKVIKRYSDVMLGVIKEAGDTFEVSEQNISSMKGWQLWRKRKRHRQNRKAVIQYLGAVR